MAAGAAGKLGDSLADQLLRAFAEELGVWPSTRAEWGAWKRSFKKLAERKLHPPTVDELRQVARAYLKRWPKAPAEIAAAGFGLEKAWLRISATLQPTYFALSRWASDTAWRLPADEAEWIIETATQLTEEQRADLRDLAARVRLAHVDVGSEILRWVEDEGWALDESDWRTELALRFPNSLGTRKPAIRRDAIKRRIELREQAVDASTVEIPRVA